MLKSMEKIWARATGHLMGNSDEERPDVPILTLREARVEIGTSGLSSSELPIK